MKRALGLVEVLGLVAAVTVADDMVKCANVELIGYELARGYGMATVKSEGDVGAVQAAISCGEATAKAMNMFVGKKVIARPAEGLEVLVNNSLTVGCPVTKKKSAQNDREAPEPNTKLSEKPAIKKPKTTEAKTASASAVKTESKPAVKTESKPAVKTESKPTVKAESKPAAKPVVKTESKPTVKAESKPAAKSSSKPKTETAKKPVQETAKPLTEAAKPLTEEEPKAENAVPETTPEKN
ncbi:MAG: BMC domain-containing protein [Oscillospiraceae bacterium]